MAYPKGMTRCLAQVEQGVLCVKVYELKMVIRKCESTTKSPLICGLGRKNSTLGSNVTRENMFCDTIRRGSGVRSLKPNEMVHRHVCKIIVDFKLALLLESFGY